MVTKTVSCPNDFTCLPPSTFTMRINGNTGNGNPSRASFVGSTGGITITLIFGDYIVTDDVQANASSPLEVVKHFDADCSCISQQSVKAKCNVINEFAVKEYLFLSMWGYRVNGSG